MDSNRQNRYGSRTQQDEDSTVAHCRGSAIKIILHVKNDPQKLKKWDYGGTKSPDNEKGVRLFIRNPSF
jgi:hypothetical protein